VAVLIGATLVIYSSISIWALWGVVHETDGIQLHPGVGTVGQGWGIWAGGGEVVYWGLSGIGTFLGILR